MAQTIDQQDGDSGIKGATLGPVAPSLSWFLVLS